jgi:hypothetical protein
MTPKIAHHLNKPILVSIPALFEDGKCRPFTLLGGELHGLWLDSAELAERLMPDDRGDYASTTVAVFVPFAQIAGVMVVTGVSAAPPSSAGGDKPIVSARPPAHAKGPAGRRAANGLKRKR